MVLAREVHAIRTKTIVNITGWLKFHAIYANLYVKLFFLLLGVEWWNENGILYAFLPNIAKGIFHFPTRCYDWINRFGNLLWILFSSIFFRAAHIEFRFQIYSKFGHKFLSVRNKSWFASILVSFFCDASINQVYKLPHYLHPQQFFFSV